MKYTQTDEITFLKELREKVLTENLRELTIGTMLFRASGVIVTDDLDQEFIAPDSRDVIVDTEYAQELSWLFKELTKGLAETIMAIGREEFFSCLADSANACTVKTFDRTALLLAVLAEAAMLVAQVRQQHCDRIRDEALSCAASLTDLAEKM